LIDDKLNLFSFIQLLLMKLLIILIAFIVGAIPTFGQTAADYLLKPGYAITVSPGQKVAMAVVFVDSTGTMHDGIDDPSPVWNINGHDLLHLQSDDGNFKANGLDLQSGTYTAPATMPKNNPVMVSVRFHASTKPGSTEMVTMQCAVTVADAYKIEGDIDMDASVTGMNISMHIDDQVRYTILNNGAAMLEPVNGKGSLHVKIVNKIMVQKDGAFGTYKSPMEYDIPVLISIDHADGGKSSPATMYFKTFSSPNNDETYQLTSGTASTPFKENFINSVLMVVFMKDARNAVNENRETGHDNVAWAERMQALRNKPQSEWTEQDKKDFAQLQALKQKMGANPNSFSNIPVDDKGNTVDNNNGKLTSQGVTKEQHQVPASATGNGMGMMNFHCTFNPQASTVLEINKEDSDMAGMQHAKIHLTVKKER
jgi:hypothetical protein